MIDKMIDHALKQHCWALTKTKQHWLSPNETTLLGSHQNETTLTGCSETKKNEHTKMIDKMINGLV